MSDTARVVYRHLVVDGDFFIRVVVGQPDRWRHEGMTLSV